MFQSLCFPSLKVSECPSCIHSRRDPRVACSQFQKTHVDECDLCLFGEDFRFPVWRNMHILLDGVVSCRDGQNKDGLRTCSHEEADTRMLLHIKYTMNSGFMSVMIRTVDTDVVVLDVAHFQGLPNVEQLWIAFGTDKDSDTSRSMRMPLHYVLRWPQDCCCYFMHSPAATSYFTNRGKKSAWKTSLGWPEITPSFVTLSMP